MTSKAIFLNPAGRVRSGWRFLIFILLFTLILVPGAGILNFVLSSLPIGYAQGSLLFISVNFGAAFLVALGAGWLCGKLLEGLPFRALGAAFTKNWLKDLGLGLVIGGATFCAAVVIAILFGGLGFHVNRQHGASAILLTLGVSMVVFIVGAAFEEAFCRGYILQTFVRARLAWLAILLTSLFFAAGHLRNPSINWIALINTALAGVWFSIAYLKTRTLWLPFGMHFMWNWVQGSVFGIEVSGLTEISTAPLLIEVDQGPAWLTGANYGLEGSVTCTIILIASTLAIHFLPVLKPTDDMLALTDREQPAGPNQTTV